MGSLEGRSHANMHYEMLKLKVLLSSYLFQEQFPDHHAEIIRSLPLQDYLSGLLNLAANSLLDAAKPDLGPRLYISFGSPDNLTQADFLTKLCYNSHDMVSLHTSVVSQLWIILTNSLGLHLDMWISNQGISGLIQQK